MTPEQLETLAAYHDSQKKYWGTDSPPGKSHRGWAAQLRAMAEERREEDQRLADAVAAVKLLVPFIHNVRRAILCLEDVVGMSEALDAGETVLVRATVVLARRQRMERERDARIAGQERNDQ